MPALRTILLTTVAMIAFAANSLLCRMALGQDLIDPASFATVRALSGAAMLWIIVLFRHGTILPDRDSVPTILALFAYMIFFAFGYMTLEAGTGALILFGAVQLTMFTSGLRSGEHFTLLSWTGFALAVLGLVYLVSPGVSAPDPTGAVFMTISGAAWGLYSLFAKRQETPLRTAAKSFAGAVPLTLAVSLLFWGDMSGTAQGIALAVLSGAVTSACGYVIWFAALPGLTATGAATVQLVVPAIAAFGGIMLLSEDLTLRLILASVATLGGVGIVLAQRKQKTPTL